MNSQFDETWLLKAMQLETEANCDIQAGLNIENKADIYLESAQSYINHERLLSMLREELGTLFKEAELEDLAVDFQARAREKVIEKLKVSRSA
jgi:heme oxygenase